MKEKNPYKHLHSTANKYKITTYSLYNSYDD